MEIINFIDVLSYYIFPWRSGNHQAKIAVNSFTAAMLKQAIQSKFDNSFLITDHSVDWSKTVTIRTPHNNILYIERDDTLKNMEYKKLEIYDDK